MSKQERTIILALVLSLSIVLGLSHSTKPSKPMGTSIMVGAYG